MRRVFLGLLSVGWLGLAPFVSCSSSQPSSGCQSEANCRTDELCVSQQCVKISPDSGADAPEASAGTCIGKQSNPTAGSHCSCAADCDSPEVCLDETSAGVPGGLCARPCLSDACPGQMVCLQATPGATGTETCFNPCTKSSDCLSGQICQNLEAAGALVCASYCQSDADCPTVGTCDRYSGLCAPAPLNPSGKETGEPCVNDTDCKSEFCIAGITEFPDGYCTAFCSIEKQGCPAGSACMPIWSAIGDQGLCLKTCNTVDDCRTGYGCVYDPSVPGVKVCGP
jgi:hypothetical protein